MNERIGSETAGPEAPGPQGAGSPTPRRTNVALIVTSIVGGVLLLAAIGAAATAGVLSLTRSGAAQTLTADARGIAELDIDASSADFRIVYDDAAEPGSAVLEAGDGDREWVLRRDGETLVAEPRSGFSWNWLRFGPGVEQTVVLHLPGELRETRLDAELELSSGSLRAEGRFGELDIDVSSGMLTVEGEARSLDIDVSSGRAEFRLADVEEASLGLSSGDLVGEFSGAAPREVEIEVSSGRAEATLPDVPYAVAERVSSGTVDNRLRTDPASRNGIEVGVSSGAVVLRPAG